MHENRLWSSSVYQNPNADVTEHENEMTSSNPPKLALSTWDLFFDKRRRSITVLYCYKCRETVCGLNVDVDTGSIRDWRRLGIELIFVRSNCNKHPEPAVHVLPMTQGFRCVDSCGIDDAILDFFRMENTDSGVHLFTAVNPYMLLDELLGSKTCVRLNMHEDASRTSLEVISPDDNPFVRKPLTEKTN